MHICDCKLMPACAHSLTVCVTLQAAAAAEQLAEARRLLAEAQTELSASGQARRQREAAERQLLEGARFVV